MALHKSSTFTATPCVLAPKIQNEFFYQAWNSSYLRVVNMVAFLVPGVKKWFYQQDERFSYFLVVHGSFVIVFLAPRAQKWFFYQVEKSSCLHGSFVNVFLAPGTQKWLFYQAGKSSYLLLVGYIIALSVFFFLHVPKSGSYIKLKRSLK